MSEALVQLGEEIKAALPGAVTEAVVAFEELTIHAEAASIVAVLRMSSAMWDRIWPDESRG